MQRKKEVELAGLQNSQEEGEEVAPRRLHDRWSRCPRVGREVVV